MKIFEVEFFSGTRYIVFANRRMEIWAKYSGIVKIHEVVIH